MRKFTAFVFALLLACGATLAAQEDSDDGAMPEVEKKIVLDDSTLLQKIKEAIPIQFNAYGKAVWAPFVYRGRGNMVDYYDMDKDAAGPGYGVGAGPGWDNIGAAVGIEMRGSSKEETIGFELRLRGIPRDGAVGETSIIDIRSPDNMAYLWARPFGEVLKLQFGQYQWDDARGKIGGIGEIVGGYGGGEDDIFQRLESDTFGALFILTPPDAVPDAVKGLTLFATFGVTGGTDSPGTKTESFAAKTENGLKYIFTTPHAGISYQHEAFGLARLQFIGSNYIWGNGEDASYNVRTLYYPWYGSSASTHFFFPFRVREAARLEFAVNVTSISNLNIDLGFGIPFAVKVTEDDNGAVKPAGPTYDDLRYRGESKTLETRIARTAGDVWQPPVKIAAGADFAVDNGFGLRFRAKVEFGEKIVFEDDSDDFIGGVKMEFGLEPRYTFKKAEKVIGTASLNAGVRINQNDSFKGLKGEGLDTEASVTAANSFSHNGVIDLGLGAFFSRPLTRNGKSYIKAGVSATLPLGGDRYNWSNSSLTVSGNPSANREFFYPEATEAYKKGNLIIAVPIILEMYL